MSNVGKMEQVFLDCVAIAQLSRRRLLILAGATVSPPTQTTCSEKERLS